MPSQKTFKRRVRARSAKTGESYTAARAQLVRRADARAAEPAPVSDETTQPPSPALDPEVELPTSDEALRGATGLDWAGWFAALDAWGATAKRHPDIARWLREVHGVDGWWAQSITVGYERARRIRAKHQIASGFSVSANRTIEVPVDRLKEAVTGESTRRQWLPDVELRRRPTRAETSARFDWPKPPSIVVAYFAAKGEGKSTLTVQHERLPDQATADRLKLHWRERLAALKELLETR